MLIEFDAVTLSESVVLGEGAFAVVVAGKWAGTDVACKLFTKGKHFKLYDPFVRELSIHR